MRSRIDRGEPPGEFVDAGSLERDAPFRPSPPDLRRALRLAPFDDQRREYLKMAEPDLHRLLTHLKTSGEIASGATIFDRRPMSPHRADIEVAMEVDVAAVTDWLVRGLAEAGRQT